MRRNSDKVLKGIVNVHSVPHGQLLNNRSPSKVHDLDTKLKVKDKLYF